MKSTSKRKIVILLGTCIFTILLYALFNRYYVGQPQNAIFSLDIQSDKVDEYSVYYDLDGSKEWTEEQCVKVAYTDAGKYETLKFNIPLNSKNIRVDLGNSPTTMEIRELSLKKSEKYSLKDEVEKLNNIKKEVELDSNNGLINVRVNGNDPYIEFNNISEILLSISGKSMFLNVAMIIGSILLGFIAANSVVELKNAIKFIKVSLENKSLIKTLSKNDFKNKYASSYLGVLWGFIQPLVTIGVYWFVFQVGFRSGDVGNGVPFIVWFICGIIPWFFFSEALPSTTNVFLEYSYLVKKVVFKIEILPAVKIISALFVHGFFIVFIFLIMAAYGYRPDVYTLQFIYYSFCMVVLVIVLSIFTSAVILFFRDLGQIINIIISVGFWFTPIGWQLTMLPNVVARFFKLNPMYYVVTGYRDSFIDKIFMWQRPYETIYFWMFCIVALAFGVKMFNKLKPHFSDVI